MPTPANPIADDELLQGVPKIPKSDRQARSTRTPELGVPRPPSVSRTYVAAWVLIGLTSASYIAAAAFEPELLAALTGSSKQVAIDTSGMSPASRQTVVQVQQLQKVVTTLVGDVSQLKSNAQQQSARQIEVVDRVATIESRLSGISASAPLVLPEQKFTISGVATAPDTTAPPSSATKLADQMAEPTTAQEPQVKLPDVKNQARLSAATIVQTVPMVATVPVATGPSPIATAPMVRSAPAAETRASRQALQDPAAVQLLPSSIETGSVARPPIPPSPLPAAAPVMLNVAKAVAPVAKPRPGAAAAVQIAAGPSVDALRLNWMLLSDRHRNVLKPLEPRFVSDSTGMYRLVAGPFASPADAQRACADLKARGASCQTTDFGGEAL
jgi:TolA-binding protein